MNMKDFIMNLNKKPKKLPFTDSPLIYIDIITDACY